MKIYTGTVDLDEKKLRRMPQKPDGSFLFGGVKIIGHFFCTGNDLRSLVGSPVITTESYWVNMNENLESLEGATQQVGNNFKAGDCRLNSLVGGPTRVAGNYDVRRNQLIDLVGAPSIIYRDFVCSYNPLKSLVGCPTRVDGDFYAIECGFTEQQIREVCLVRGFVRVYR
jgi:hypothetical protein